MPRINVPGGDYYKLPKTTSTGNLGGGGGITDKDPTKEKRPKAVPAPAKSVKYTLPGAPDWWVGNTSGGVMNALIPYLSPEDQRAVMNRLQTSGAFKGYAGVFPSAPSDLSGQLRYDFTTAQRAQNIMNALDTYRKASGGKDLGGGYQFLRNVAATTLNFSGGGTARTRLQQKQLEAALAPMFALAKEKGVSQSYQDLARTITDPFFSAGKLASVAPNPTNF